MKLCDTKKQYTSRVHLSKKIEISFLQLKFYT